MCAISSLTSTFAISSDEFLSSFMMLIYRSTVYSEYRFYGGRVQVNFCLWFIILHAVSVLSPGICASA